jgi:hypothetical protein
MQGGWGVVGLALVFLNFALPFFLLLFRHIKRRMQSLMLLRSGAGDAPGGYVLDGASGVWRFAARMAAGLRWLCCCRWEWAAFGLDISLAIAADAAAAGERSADGRSHRTCRRAWVTQPPGDPASLPTAVAEPSEALGYETRDANTRACWDFWHFGACFGLNAALDLAGVSLLLGRGAAPAPGSSFAGVSVQVPPGPELEVHPRQDLLKTYAEEQRELLRIIRGRTAARDVRIPIERAMDLLLQKGCPCCPAGCRNGKRIRSTKFGAKKAGRARASPAVRAREEMTVT